MDKLLPLLLPEEIIEFFEIDYCATFCSLEDKEEGTLIHLIEKNILPGGYDSSDYESKDLLPAVVIQDFPIRGKSIFYSIRKRRWRNKSDKSQIIQRKFTFTTEGTRLTADLVAFLKKQVETRPDTMKKTKELNKPEKRRKSTNQNYFLMEIRRKNY